MSNRRAAIEIIQRLQREGFQALLAGGCVRDMLLGRPAKDYDVATEARPEQVMALFSRTLKVGAKFGVVIVLRRGQQVEVATFREEAGYDDGRHPTQVTFTGAAEDAARRDFTVNGMFYDPQTEQVIDYVDGQADLQRRVIRTIGHPDERFGEDYLRMLRAVRFQTQLGFAIEPATYAGITRHADRIRQISGERIALELKQMFVHPNRAAGAAVLLDTGLLEAIFPDFGRPQAGRGVEVLGQLRKNVSFPLGLAALFAGCRTGFAAERCRILKLSRNQSAHLRFLLSYRRRLLDADMPLSKLKRILAEPHYRDLYDLERAIQKAAGDRDGLNALARLRRRIRDLGDVDVKPAPLLSGHDLIRLGAVPGPTLGRLADDLYTAQLENEIATKEQAEHWARAWLEKRTGQEE
jgi:poly(A) polymerase